MEIPEQNGSSAWGKAAVVGVVGRTNAGKSTIVNRLVGEKVSIVSPVEQTTRNTIRCIVADPRGQLVLLDTPGLHKAVGPLGKILNGMARRTSADTDILCVVFDASHEPQMEDEGWMARVAKEKPASCVFVLNKADRKPFYETMFREAWKKLACDDVKPVWVMSVATQPDGCRALADALFAAAPTGPALFPEDIATDYPRKLAIADVIREKLIQRVFDEVPHETGVVVTEIFEDRKTGWDVSVAVYVNRPSQKGIVIGPEGRTIKSVRKSAEPELSDMFGIKVHLDIRVKVERDWMKNGRLLAEMGYTGSVL